MSTTRRYSDKEAAAIFRAATESTDSSQREVPSNEGLTLADLQAIGRDVGIPPDAVARAAAALEISQRPASRTLLGLPIGVARTVDLNRRLSDPEWERLVVQLREVFEARGRTRSEGSFREWTNGNLQVLLEPTETGHRLRFRTLHGAAWAYINGGIAALGMTAALVIATALSGQIVKATPGIAFMFSVGVFMIASGAFRLPKWARLRGHQMDALAAQVAGSPPALPDPSSHSSE